MSIRFICSPFPWNPFLPVPIIFSTWVFEKSKDTNTWHQKSLKPAAAAGFFAANILLLYVSLLVNIIVTIVWCLFPTHEQIKLTKQTKQFQQKPNRIYLWIFPKTYVVSLADLLFTIIERIKTSDSEQTFIQFQNCAHRETSKAGNIHVIKLRISRISRIWSVTCNKASGQLENCTKRSVFISK